MKYVSSNLDYYTNEQLREALARNIKTEKTVLESFLSSNDWQMVERYAKSLQQHAEAYDNPCRVKYRGVLRSALIAMDVRIGMGYEDIPESFKVNEFTRIVMRHYGSYIGETVECHGDMTGDEVKECVLFAANELERMKSAVDDSLFTDLIHACVEQVDWDLLAELYSEHNCAQ